MARAMTYPMAYTMVHHKFCNITNCDPPWENREKGEHTDTRVMTQHAKRVTRLSDMCICNTQNKECHGRYCFAR